MIKCPKCGQDKSLDEWWRKHRLPQLKKIESDLCEFQTKWVANNISKDLDVTDQKPYLESEKKIKQVWRLIEMI